MNKLLAHPLVDEEFTAAKAQIKWMIDNLGYIDINALDPLDPVHANNARLARYGEDIDAQGDPDWSTNPGLYAISAATKGAV